MTWWQEGLVLYVVVIVLFWVVLLKWSCLDLDSPRADDQSGGVESSCGDNACAGGVGELIP